MFKIVDTNGDKKIDIDEFKKILKISIDSQI